MRSYYEPWRAAPNADWREKYREPPEEPEARAQWESDRAASEKAAVAHVWATDMHQPGHSVGLTSGQKVYHDGSGILVVVRPEMTRDGRIEPLAFAERIAECVNFCAGMDLSKQGQATLRDLIHELDRLAEQLTSEAYIPKPPRKRKRASDATP